MRSDYEFILRAWRGGLRFQMLGFVIANVAAGGWSDRNRVQSLRERWTLLREAGAFSAKLLPHFGLSFFLAALSPIAKTFVTYLAVSAITKLMIRYHDT